MASINKVLLMGNLTRDVETRYTPSGSALARFGLAVNRKFRDSKTNELREEVTFVDIDVWGKQAEAVGQYLSKGRPVFIEGRLKLDQWDDKQSGQKRTKLFVVADKVQFLGSGGGAQGGTSAPRSPQAAPPPREVPQTEESRPDVIPDDLGISEENIPF